MAINLELASRIKDISTPRETREDVVEYYQEKYPENWSRKLAEAHQGFTTGKKTTFQGIPSIQRRFQARGGKKWEDINPSTKQQEEYAAHGEYLPPKPPGGVTIEGTFCVRYRDEPCETRTFTETMSGDEMKYLLKSYDAQVLINKYMKVDLDDDEPTIEECPCGTDGCECEIISVTVLED